jgi:hypothetical protein
MWSLFVSFDFLSAKWKIMFSVRDSSNLHDLWHYRTKITPLLLNVRDCHNVWQMCIYHLNKLLYKNKSYWPWWCVNSSCKSFENSSVQSATENVSKNKSRNTRKLENCFLLHFKQLDFYYYHSDINNVHSNWKCLKLSNNLITFK